MKNIMLDLETLSLDPNAVILSISAVTFDLKTGKTGSCIEVFLETAEQEAVGGRVSLSTIEFWVNQDRELMVPTLFNQNATSVKKALCKFSDWLNSLVSEKHELLLWGNGVSADNVWIRNIYRRYNIPFPLSYWQDMDLRTLTQIIDYDEVKKRCGDFVGVKHCGLDDCKNQIRMAHEAYKMLKE
jgi:hypothetical protein